MSHVDEALLSDARAHLEEAVGIAARASARRRLAKVLGLHGELDLARAYAHESTGELSEAGQHGEAAATGMYLANIEERAGNLDAAEQALRDSAEALERLGHFGYYTTVVLLLAGLLARRGAYAEAARWCAVARGRMGDDDIADVILADAVEGFLAATNGAAAEGERLARHAVEVAEPTDAFETKAGAYEWLARTLALVGKPEEARDAAAAAVEVYETKGDVAAIAWSRQLLDSLTA
jgi:hypothetical protein